jgi:hypothetical protein
VSDPVPGDPDAVLGEVDRMKSLAAMLRAEARNLRVIGADEGTGGELKGRYADALRDGARELEVRLRETAERYERVHGHLTGWAYELEGFQADADRILRAAQAAQADAAQADADDGSAGRHRTSLAKVEGLRDERAAHYARRIRHELNDTIKDSWWERRKHSLDTFKDAISFTLDVLSWAATGIAIAAIIFTPAGWVTALALWLSVGVLTGHALLAAAGLASWADVTMDIFGLLAMGVGTVALGGLRNVRTATKFAAELAAEERAAEAAARATRSLRDRTSAVVNRHGATRAARAVARHQRNVARAATRRAAREAGAGEAARPMAEASRWETVGVGGDKETANLFKDVERMRAAYPESEGVRRASEGAEGYRRVFRGAWGTSSAVDVGDKLTGESDLFPMKPSVGAYSEAKACYVKEVGSKW